MAVQISQINKDLWDRVVRSSEDRGYASPQEFVESVLEDVLARGSYATLKCEVTQKIEQLGYLDYGRGI
jgi:hypothetical protein